MDDIVETESLKDMFVYLDNFTFTAIARVHLQENANRPEICLSIDQKR